LTIIISLVFQSPQRTHALFIILQLSGALENAKAEIQKMQQEKDHFEDSMKKAFMRGVCALNLEAMTIFQNKNEAGE
jgi:centrosomal protein POC5